MVMGASLSSLHLHLSQAAMERYKGTRCFKVILFKLLSLCYLVKSMCLVTTSSSSSRKLTSQETFASLWHGSDLKALRVANIVCRLFYFNMQMFMSDLGFDSNTCVLCKSGTNRKPLHYTLSYTAFLEGDQLFWQHVS